MIATNISSSSTARSPTPNSSLKGEYDVFFADIGSSLIRKNIALKKANLVLSSSDQVEIGKPILRSTSDDATAILEALFEDPAPFETATSRDAELFRDPKPFRDVHGVMAGELDD